MSVPHKTSRPYFSIDQSQILNELFSIIHELHSTLNVNSLQEKILEACIYFFQAKQAALFACVPSGQPVIRTYRKIDKMDEQPIFIPENVFSSFVKPLKPAFFTYSPSLSGNRGEKLRGLCVPLQIPSHSDTNTPLSQSFQMTTGVLYIDCNDTDANNAINEDNLPLLHFIASQASVALTNATKAENSTFRYNTLETQMQEQTLALSEAKQKVLEGEGRVKELNTLLQKKLIDKEYKSDLVDITTGTLHNVKNILTSIKLSSEILQDIYNAKTMNGFKKANQLLSENIDNLEDFICVNPKGKKLLLYYLQIEKIIESKLQDAQKHLARLKERVNLIEEIITAQQDYAYNILVPDVLATQVIEDALLMQAGSIENFGIIIHKNYSIIPRIPISKTKLIQILINLIKNSREAMIETPIDRKVLEISVFSDQYFITISISDSGCGIPAKDLQNIFSYGFTTKKEGHGFGLHSCMVYLKEMGGQIIAQSDGPGKGSVFTIKLPIPKEKRLDRL